MSEYRRFVTYIYEYTNGKKNKNTGFAKVESRNGTCRIQVHLQKVPQEDEALNIYGFVRESGWLLGIFLGKMYRRGSACEARIQTQAQKIGGSVYALEQLAGLWVESGGGRKYLTVFDEESVDTARLVTELPQKVHTEKTEERRGESREEEQEKIPEERQEEKRKEEREEIPKERREEKPEERQEEKREEERKEIPKERREENPEERRVEKQEEKREEIPEERRAEISEEKQEESRKGETKEDQERVREIVTDKVQEESQEKVQKENQMETAERKPEKAEGEKREESPEKKMMEAVKRETEEISGGIHGKASEEKQAEVAVSHPEKLSEEMQGKNTEDSGTEMQETTEKNTKEYGTEIQETTEKNTEEYGTEMQQDPESGETLGMLHTQEAAACPVMRQNCPRFAPCAVNLDQKWQYMSRRYPHFRPFSDDEVADCIQITPRELNFILQGNWRTGNNSFLMHGFCNYRHLLFGKRKDGRYLLGIPGIHENQELFMANMFGFPVFKEAVSRHPRGRFGYWCRIL